MTTTFLSFFPTEFLSTLPLPLLRAFAFQNPVEAAGAWAFVPVAMWLIVLLGYALPPLITSGANFMRQSDSGFVTLFVLLVLAGAFYAFPSSASKGGGTNTPPPAVAHPVKQINLYYQDATGRLFPLGARIKEDK